MPSLPFWSSIWDWDVCAASATNSAAKSSGFSVSVLSGPDGSKPK